MADTTLSTESKIAVLYGSLIVAGITACVPGARNQLEIEAQADADAVYNILAAEFAMHAGQEQTATDYYAKAIENISDVEILKDAALLAYQQKNYHSAARIAERWLELEPDNAAVRQRLAVIYLSINRLNDAIALIEQMPPLHVDALFIETSQYGLLEQSEATLDLVRRLSEHFSDYYLARFLYATLALQLEKYDLAEKLADGLIDMDVSRPEGYKVKAHVLKQNERNEEALAVLQQGVEMGAADAQLRKNYARALVDGQRYQEAYDELTLIYGENRDDPEVIQMLAVSSLSIGDLDEAERYVNLLADFPGLQLRSRFFQAYIFYQKQDYDQAIAALNDIPTETGALFEEAQLLLVRIYQDLGRVDEAIKQLGRARRVNDDKDIDVTFYLAEGQLLMQREDYSGVYVLYTDAIDEYPDINAFFYMRAIAASELKHIDQMESDIQVILARDPLNVDALNAFGYCLADNNLRLHEAKRYIAQALELSPDNPAIIDSMGWVEFRLDNLEDAEALVRTAKEKLDDPVIYGHLVEILRARNRSAEAERYLLDGLERFPDNKYLNELKGF